MPCEESSRKHLSSCRIRKCSATCAGRRKITIAGYQAWPRSRRGCGKITGSKEDPHGEERGTRVSNHEAPLDLILRDARKSAPQDEGALSSSARRVAARPNPRSPRSD